MMLGVLSREVLSEAGVNKMLRAARDSIHTATCETLNPAAETVLSLRQLLLAGMAAAWSASEGREDPSLEQARALARDILDDAAAEIIDTRESLVVSQEATLIETPAPTQVPTQRPEFSFDPDIVALIERINAERDRDHIKEDTRKQLAAQPDGHCVHRSIQRPVQGGMPERALVPDASGHSRKVGGFA